MTTELDSLEEKVNLLTENLKLREELEKLQQKFDKVPAQYRSTAVSDSSALFEKPKLPRRKHLLYAGMGLLLSASALFIYFQFRPADILDNQRGVSTPSRAGKVIAKAAEPSEPNSISSARGYEFNDPIDLEIRDDKAGEPVVYVYDKATGSLHRFSNSEPFHSIGKYGSQPNPTTKQSSPFTKAFSLNEEGKKVTVDNFDGTVTSYQLPDLHFLQREYGTILNDDQVRDICDRIEPMKKSLNEFITRNLEKIVSNYEHSQSNLEKNFSAELIEKCRDKYAANLYAQDYSVNRYFYSNSPDHLPSDIFGQNFSAGSFRWAVREYIERQLAVQPPTYYTLLNDAPSRFPVKFTRVLAFKTVSADVHRCGFLPVIGFNDTEEVAMFGYICNNGDLELQQKIPYHSLAITKSTAANLIDVFAYRNDLYLLEQGSKKIKRIWVLPDKK